MPQAGSTAILSYHTTTALAVPSNANLSAGELALNVTDLKIYTENGAGTVVQVGSGPSAVDTLTNKSVNLASNTLTGTTAQFNAALSDGDFATQAGVETLTNKTLALGNNTVSGTLAQFNTAVTDAELASLAGIETLTNKTLTAPVVNSPTGITKTDVGLSNADNTSDANKPVSTAQQTALNLKAALASPALTGTPTAPTAAPGTNTTQLASTAFVIAQAFSATGAERTANKDASGGYAGLTLFKLNLKNAAGTFTNFFTNATTAARTWTLPDTDGTVALTSDITGAGFATRTGVETLTNKTFTGYTETVYALAGTVLDVANGTIQTKTLAANTTFTESMADGQSLILGITAGAYSVTWPSVTWTKVGGSGVAPALTSAGVNWIILWQTGGVLRGSFMGTA